MFLNTLWKRRGGVLQCGKELGLAEKLDLRTEASRSRIVRTMVLNAEAKNFRGGTKKRFGGRLAELLDISYEEIIANRMFQLMTLSERTQLASAGVSFQLHTHRHRTPIDQNLFRKEIQDNRRNLQQLGDKAIYFCYPSGIYRSDFCLGCKWKTWFLGQHVTLA